MQQSALVRYSGRPLGAGWPRSVLRQYDTFHESSYCGYQYSV